MTDVDTVELKPCPFCGSAPTKEHWAQRYLECKVCGTYGPDAQHPERPEDAWNTRAALPPAVPATTPDPVAEAAKVLLANMPNPVFDNLKPVLMGEFGVTVEGCDEDGEECHYIEPIGWSTIKDILLMAVRALTKDGEAG